MNDENALVHLYITAVLESKIR